MLIFSALQKPVVRQQAAGNGWPGIALIELVSLILMLALCAPVNAVIVRHDIDGSRYLQIGDQLDGLCHLNLQQGSGPPDGEGVLIHPRWILTAAHVGAEVRPGHVVTVTSSKASLDVAAEAVVIHPDWGGGPHDIALIRLAQPVRIIAPLALYRDRDEPGQRIIIGGMGDFGTGRTGPTGNDGKLRIATNKIDDANEYWLKFRFDEPEQATDLEGVSGPGDSGGPALLRKDGFLYVVGISAGQETSATGGREGLYGVYEFYTRVSSYLDWIDKTLAQHAESEQ